MSVNRTNDRISQWNWRKGEVWRRKSKRGLRCKGCGEVGLGPCQGGACRASSRYPPPRSQAWEHLADIGRQSQDYGFRPGVSVCGGVFVDRQRSTPGNSRLYGARTGIRLERSKQSRGGYLCGSAAILYELLTGRPPFRGATALEIQRKVTSEEPVRPSRFNLKVPRDLDTICLKCLHKSPADRYENAAAAQPMIWTIFYDSSL